MDPARIEELRRRIDADPTSIAFAELAEEYRRSGHFREAIALCRTGLARHPAYLSARVTLGRALTEVGDLPSARAELEQVLRVAPASLAALRALADVHQRLGEPEVARMLLERASATAQEDLDLHEASDEIARHLAPRANAALAPETPPDVPDPADATDRQPVVAVTEATREMPKEQADPRAAQLAALERFLSAIESATRRAGDSTSPR